MLGEGDSVVVCGGGGFIGGHLVGDLLKRGAVLVDLSESGAFRDRTANQVFVSNAYTEILRQTPDIAGYNHWVGILNAGQSPQAVIDGLLSGR